MTFDTVPTVSAELTERIDRRSVLRLAAGLGAAAIAGGTLARETGAQEAAAASGSYRTTTALNLRTGPSTNRRVILVIPQNGLVKDLGGNKNGFRQVSYKGTEGWASLSYLVVADGGSDPVISGTAVTTTAVNFRSGPSTSNTVLRVLAKGTRVETSLTVQNGFRYVVHNGLAGWVYDEFLAIEGDSPPEGTLVTTAALNLRAEPSLSAKVLTVMPSGARVTPTGQGSGQFAQVVYGNLTGWAATAYLN
ncbi:MAG: SH3 domain-containing protein [Chloroflexota bacterium]|nr:SH3 domain-containing protein [Chloroflexota bacterium]